MSEYIAPIGKELYIISTGDWRTHRPVKDATKCNNCGICSLYCPTGSIVKHAGGGSTHPDGDSASAAAGTWAINLTYCKGCGICAHECPRKAVVMVEEGVKAS